MDHTASEEEEEEEKEVVQCGKTQKSAPPLRDSERMQIRENVFQVWVYVSSYSSSHIKHYFFFR